MKQERKNNMDWQNTADGELNTSEWFGAIIRYFWHFGRKKFKSFYIRKESKKNILIGYLFKIFILIGFILILYLYYQSEV